MIYDALTLELADETGLRPSLVADFLAVCASAGDTSGGAAAFLRGNPDPYFVATAIMMIADSGREQRLEQGLADIVAEHGEWAG
jgi:hypothetical protein